MRSGWAVQVVAASGDVQVEFLGPGAEDWYAEGPGGDALGPLEQVLEIAAGPDVDQDWARAVHAAVVHEAGRDVPRTGLVVDRGAKLMFRATRSANRASIQRHGLDWTKMATPGIAGSTEPEHHGSFLCATIEDARWFAAMPRSERVDIWRVRVDGLWLISDPSSSGGLDNHWAIATEPIGANRLELVERDLIRADAS